MSIEMKNVDLVLTISMQVPKDDDGANELMDVLARVCGAMAQATQDMLEEGATCAEVAAQIEFDMSDGEYLQ